MNAEIDDKGRLLITPSSQTEAFALKIWMDESRITVDDLMRNEKTWYRGSRLVLIQPANYA